MAENKALDIIKNAILLGNPDPTLWAWEKIPGKKE